MTAVAAVAISNAQYRARLGWPLVLLTIAVYAPIGGLPRLALIGTGLFFLAQKAVSGPAGKPEGKAGTGPATPKPASGPKTPRPKRPAKQPVTAGAEAPVGRLVKAKAPLSKVPRQRGADGRWLR